MTRAARLLALLGALAGSAVLYAWLSERPRDPGPTLAAVTTVSLILGIGIGPIRIRRSGSRALVQELRWAAAMIAGVATVVLVQAAAEPILPEAPADVRNTFAGVSGLVALGLVVLALAVLVRRVTHVEEGPRRTISGEPISEP